MEKIRCTLVGSSVLTVNVKFCYFQFKQFHQGPQPAGTTQYAQPLQYLAATPPSTTPSPGQPHQQVCLPDIQKN